MKTAKCIASAVVGLVAVAALGLLAVNTLCDWSEEDEAEDFDDV